MGDSGETLAARVAALEMAVDGLRRDLAQLRQELARPPRVAEPPRPAPAVIAAIPAPARRRANLPDFETLVGRYGMLALATVLALAAVGTFVGWAIAHGLLGPVPRVVLGLVVAAAVGAWGARLRTRERSFGDSLLALSLAIVHVCAWAAGPGMQLVPPFLALALSAVASVALAGYALVEGDEPLWCVGFGGAAVAPFVTSTGQGTAPMLTAYAAAVLIASGSALGSRAWTIASRVFGAAALLFVGAIATLPSRQYSAELALALPFVAAAFAVVPFARGAAIRPRLRTLGLLAGVMAVNLAVDPAIPHWAAAAAIGVAGAAWLVLVELVESEPAGTLVDGFAQARPELCDWFDGAVIPGAFLLSLGIALGETDTGAAAQALAAAVLVLFASRREGALRDAAALPAFVAAIAATLIATRSSPFLASAVLSAVSVAFVVLEREIPNRTWRWAPQAALVLTSLLTLAFLTARRSYEYVPFGTRESAAALAVALAWAAAAALSEGAAVLVVAGCLFVFGWVHQELAWAASPSTSTVLLVSWYAVSSVGCVGFGRWRGFARLRHVGLGLGIAAAVFALKAAWGLPSTAARIGAYLVVSVFLLGIAWWYRRPGPGPVTHPGP